MVAISFKENSPKAAAATDLGNPVIREEVDMCKTIPTINGAH